MLTFLFETPKWVYRQNFLAFISRISDQIFLRRSQRPASAPNLPSLITESEWSDTQDIIGMDLKNLSSNWKKLQGTLRKKDNVSASAPKRKPSERESQNGAVKKRKREDKPETKILDRPIHSTKRKRMSEGGETLGASDPAAKPTSRRNSTAVGTAPEKEDLPKAKINEGRSPRLVMSQPISTICHHACADISNIL